MTDFYSIHSKIYVAVDCIIFGFDERGLKLLLIKRDFEPGKGDWSLMGGFLRYDESLDNAAKRILHDLTGLHNIYLEQLYTFSDPERDPGERVISAAYFSIIRSEQYNETRNTGYQAKWFPLKFLPDLVFDHKQMIVRAMKRLRRRAATEPIGFELLPEKFTIPQLQDLYEAIYQQKLDKRNFRKKIFQMNILEKLIEKDKSGSKKGAFLYRFDKERYDTLINSGDHFNFL